MDDSENQMAYQDLLLNEIFAQIISRSINGYKGIEQVKRINKDEVGSATMMLFESLDTVKEFAGEDYEKAVVSDNAQQLLTDTMTGRSTMK
ncbi:MAG: hypothetical protein ACJ75B_07990 [Flavisolibacter sp.]